MEEQLKTIELIKSADISDHEWAYNILEQMQNKFAKGYLTAKLENLNEGIMPTHEDYRDDFLKFCGYNIWK